MFSNNLIKKLTHGNNLFVNAKSKLIQPIKSVIKTYEQHQPKIGLICCVDSRIVPEFIFNQPLGTFISSRTPGNIITNSTLATMEIAILEFQIQLIIILGHTQCKAITLACTTDDKSNSFSIIKKSIEPSRKLVDNQLNKSIDNKEYIDKISLNNIILNVKSLKKQNNLINKYYSKKIRCRILYYFRFYFDNC